MTLWGSPERDAMRYFVWQDVLDELWFSCDYRPEPFTCILTGTYGIAAHGPFIEVTGFESLTYVRPGDDLVALMQPLLEESLQESPTAVAANRPGPVGCFMHAPGTGARLTEPLARLHLSLFNVPYQLTLIFDHPQRLMAGYARHPRARFYNTALHVVSPRALPHPEEE